MIFIIDRRFGNSSNERQDRDDSIGDTTIMKNAWKSPATGAGSVWSNQFSVYVGYQGNSGDNEASGPATLILSDAGTVVSSDLLVGYATGPVTNCVTVNGGNLTVGDVLEVDGGKEYTICQDDFAWPADQQPGHYAESWVNPNQDPCNFYLADFFAGSWTEDFHWLSWTNFHNHAVDLIVQTVGQSGYWPRLKDAAQKLKINYHEPQKEAPLSAMRTACSNAGSFTVYVYQGHAGILKSNNQPGIATFVGRVYDPARDTAWYFIPGVFGGTTNATVVYFLTTGYTPSIVTDFTTGGQGMSRLVLIIGCDSGTSWQAGFTQAGAVLIYCGGDVDAATASRAIEVFFDTLASSSSETIEQALVVANQIISDYNGRSHPGLPGEMDEMHVSPIGSAARTFADIMKP
jgi:hypothetical protein